MNGSDPDGARYRAAIVGLNWIGADPAGPATDSGLGTSLPYSHASAIAATPDVSVVAVCDIDQGALDRFDHNWRATWPGYAAFTDYREMFATCGLDLVAVATPDDVHTDVVLAAIDAGVKAVFCEKPLATSLAEADRIIEAAASAGVTLSVNYTRRWLPEFRLAKRLLGDGAIGDLHQIVVRHGGDRAMLFRNGTHFLDLVVFLAGSRPSWVVGETDPEHTGYGTSYRGDGGRDPDTEPGYSCYIAFENGVRAFIADSKRIARDWAVDLLGSTGRITVTAAGTMVSSAVAPDEFATRRVVPRYTVGGMAAAYAELVAALDGVGSVSSPPEEARISVALAEAILCSQSLGNRPVTLTDR